MCRNLWLIVLTCALLALSACGGGTGIVVPPKGTLVAPLLAGDVDAKSALSLWSSPADELLLKVTATNTNNPKAQLSVIRFCLKHDAAQDDPLTAEEVLVYLDPLSGDPPAEIDVVEFVFTNQGNGASQQYEFPKFKGQDFARDERYWISAVFADTQGRVSPACEPQRFKLLPAYPLLKAPKLAIEKTFVGEVRDLNGALLPEALVAYYHKGGFIEAGLTGSDGRYFFRAEVANPHSGSAVSVGEASGRGLAGGETQYVLKAYASAYPDSEVVAYLNGEYKDYEVDFSFREANQLPVAVLSAAPQQGVAPLSVAFDGSGSSDPDGQVVQYDYDWDSDGDYDAIDAGASAAHIYIEPGSYTATLRVWDDRGGSSTASVGVEVSEAGSGEICYTAQVEGQWGIWVMDSDGSNQRKVCDAGMEVAAGTAWSPSGDRIAFASTESGHYEIWVVNADGSNKIQLTSHLYESYYPCWVNDSEILYERGHDPEHEIGLFTLETSTDSQLSPSGDGWSDHMPWISPDGSRIAISRGTPGNGIPMALYVADYPVFTNPRLVADVPGGVDRYLAWKVGEVITFTNDTSAETSSNYSVNADGSNLLLLSQPGNNHDFMPKMAPDGGKIVFFASSDNVDYQIWSMNADGSGRQQLTHAQYAGCPDWLSQAHKQDNGQGDWWMRGRNPLHNSLSPYIGPATNGIKWEYATGGQVWSSPCIAADGTVYIGSHDYKLYAFNPDGSRKWEYATGGIIISSPALAEDGTVYVGSEDFRLYAIDPDGNLKWSYLTGGIIWSSPAVGSDGTVYFCSDNHKVYALNPDGTKKWDYTGDYINVTPSSPAVGLDGTIYAATGGSKLFALNHDGSHKWEYAAGDFLSSSPAVGSDGTIYVGSADMKLHAVNPDGSQKWTFQADNYFSSSPAIGANNTIYVACCNSTLYAINPDGSQQWAYSTGGWSDSSSPAIDAAGTIYTAGFYDHRLHAVNSDGTLKWTFTAGDYFYSSPAIGADGSVYIGNYDGKVYAIGPGGA